MPNRPGSAWSISGSWLNNHHGIGARARPAKCRVGPRDMTAISVKLRTKSLPASVRQYDHAKKQRISQSAGPKYPASSHHEAVSRK